MKSVAIRPSPHASRHADDAPAQLWRARSVVSHPAIPERATSAPRADARGRSVVVTRGRRESDQQRRGAARRDGAATCHPPFGPRREERLPIAATPAVARSAHDDDGDVVVRSRWLDVDPERGHQAVTGEQRDRSPDDDVPADALVTTLVEDLTRTQIVMYAGASGDFHPLHHDDVYARGRGYAGSFCPGMLTMGLAGTAVTTVLGFVKDKLPAPIASQIDNAISGEGGGAGGTLGDLASKAGGLLS